MNEKLSMDEQNNSVDAVMQFRMACTNYNLMDTNVKVINDGNVEFDDNVKVSVVEQHSWFEIPILWEDAGLSREKFRKLDYYGKYSTSYYRMEFLQHSSQLRIITNDPVMSIYIDAI